MTKLKRTAAALLFSGVLFCVFCASALAMGTDVQQTNASVNLRTGPGTNYEVMTVVPAGTTLYIEQNNGDWCCVDYSAPNGETWTGWVFTKYLGSYTPGTDTSSYYTNSTGNYRDTYTTAAVNLRSGPDTAYAVYTVIPAGSSVAVDSVANGWAHVYYGAGYEGYCAAKYISGYNGVLGDATPSYSSSNSGSGSGTTWYGGYNYANVYNYTYYKVHNADVVQAIGSDPQALIQHFVQYGMAEGRQGCESFNVYTYRDQHPDLAAQFGDNLVLYNRYACGIPL